MLHFIRLLITRPHSLAFSMLLLITTAEAALAADLTQKMRLAIGTYLIGGEGGGIGGGGGTGGGSVIAGAAGGGGNGGIGSVPLASPGGSGGPAGVQAGSLPLITLPKSDDGSGYKLPAYCIDGGRHPPGSGSTLSHVSGNVRVQQYLGQELKGEKLLNEAISGPDQWLTLAGLSGANEINIKPADAKYSYRMVVSDLAIAGETEADVKPVYQAWTSNSTLMEVSKTFDTLRRHLHSVPDIESVLKERLERFRQRLEWMTFGAAKTGAQIPVAARTLPAAVWIDAMISSDFRVATSNLTAKDRLDWFTLLRGQALDSSDFTFFANQLPKVAIPQSYDQNPSEAALLKTFSLAAAFSTPEDGALLVFHRLRANGSASFEAAMRQAALKIGGEEMWTTGQPELESFRLLDCRSSSGIDPNEKAELDHNQAQSDAGAPVRLRANTALMEYFNGYAGQPLDLGLVVVSLQYGNVCFARLGKENKVERRRTPISSLTQDVIEPYKGLRLLATDDVTADALKEKGISSSRFNDVARELSLKAFAKRENKIESTFARFNRSSPAKTGFDLTTLNLETHGDALIARLPDGTLLMIDTGLGGDTFSKLSDFLKRNYAVSKPALRLVITHSHKDHIGGLRKIVNEGFEIQEMLIGRSAKDGNAVDRLFVAPSKGRKKGDRLSAAMSAGKRTDVKGDDQPGVTHFIKAGVDPLFDAGARRISLFGNIESWSLKNISGVQIDVHHVVDARVPNEGGLLVRLGYRGMHWLLADDLDNSAWAAVARNMNTNDLRAGILKWPHHLWLPREDEIGARRLLESLLRKINPHTIIFSNTGHKSHDVKRFKEIQKFAAAVLPGVRTAWTREFGKHVVIQAELNLPH